MKKFASLMAGAAALAMIAAPAMAGTVYQGSATGSQTFYIGPFPIATLSGTTNNTTLVGLVDALNPGVNSNISLITISGSSANNNGTASNNDGATFTLKGAVTKDCAYYTGNASKTIEIGRASCRERV